MTGRLFVSASMTTTYLKIDSGTSLFVSMTWSWSRIKCIYYCFIHHMTDDSHRIKLKPIPGSEECQDDFINASYVDVCSFINRKLL